MKIYVAGKWSERDKVKQVMSMFKSWGHTITCDWTEHIAPERITQAHEKGLFNKSYDWTKNPDWINNGHLTYAQEDLLGVKDCDVLIACMWDNNLCYKGAWIEIGIAVGLNKRVIIIGSDITTVFLSLNNIVVVPYKENALELVESMKLKLDCDKNDIYDTDHFVMGL